MEKTVRQVNASSEEIKIKKKIAKARKDLAKLDLRTEKNRKTVEVLQAQINNWETELRNINNEQNTDTYAR